jgi:long-chain acyl-CoA synthetase
MWRPERSHSGVALATPSAACSYGELEADVSRRADQLRAIGGGIVVLTASMTIEFVATFLALLALRRPVAVFSSAWTPDERSSRLALLGRSVELDASSLAVRERPGEPAPLHPLSRLILFTTGSTGTPKAVQLSEANIRSNTAAVIEAVSFRTAERQTLFLPLSYSYGLLGQLLPALEVGMRTDLVNGLVGLSEDAAPASLQGMLSGVPSHFEAILRMLPPGQANDRVTHVVTAGACSPPDLRHRLRRSFPRATIFNNYGQTEASPRILCFASDHPRFFTPATGFPVGDLRVKLSPLGELLVSGSQIMLGYLGDDGGTRDKVRDGWLATGDLASLDGDGLVTVTGRTDELINVGGERTSALEIESALRRVAGVLNAGVLVVPDALYGAACIAYIESDTADVTEDGVLAQVRRLVSPHKIPRALHVIPALPLTQNGKVDKAALAALHREREGSERLPDLRR